MKTPAKLPQAIQDQLIKVDEFSDRLGLPVDDGIKLLVATLRAYGFKTVDSCEGHESRRTNGPRVWMTPEKSEALLSELSELDEDDDKARSLLRAIRHEGFYVKSDLLNLLDDFYDGREVSTWVRIIIESRGAYGDCVLICQGTATVDAIEPDDRRLKWLALAKQEFTAFTDFLIKQMSQR